MGNPNRMSQIDKNIKINPRFKFYAIIIIVQSKMDKDLKTIKKMILAQTEENHNDTFQEIYFIILKRDKNLTSYRNHQQNSNSKSFKKNPQLSNILTLTRIFILKILYLSLLIWPLCGRSKSMSLQKSIFYILNLPKHT